MAVAKKCDRCGKFYERNRGVSTCGEFVSKIQLRSNHSMLKEYDFCDDCVYKFKDFMKCKPEVKIDPNKTLDEQGLERCWTCKFYDKDSCLCNHPSSVASISRHTILPFLAVDACCTNYEGREND